MRDSWLRCARLALVLFLGSSWPLCAQAGSTLAQLNGTVHDPANATVARAAITLRELNTDQVHLTTSNGLGLYFAVDLPPGQYELVVQAAGFAKRILSGIVLRVGQVATINIGLTIATHEEQMVVTSETPMVEPSRTETSQVIEAGQVSSLPISGRLFTDFVLLTPGVSTGRTSLQSTNTEFETTRVSFGGMRDLSNEVTVDGADTINTVTGSQRATPPQEAVSEFRVVNNSFGADYGRALGGIVNITTKSGTNVMHGSVYEYFQNGATDAASLLSAPQFQTLRQNQFGATFGGPIVPNKTFYFANYEGQRRAESPTYPGYLFGDLGVINAAKAALGLSPENLNILRTKDHDNAIVRVDQVGLSNRLALRYDVEDGRDTNLLVGHTMDGGGVGAPSAAHNLTFRDQVLAGTWTANPRPNLVNAALVQWTRRSYSFPGVVGEPDLDLPNLLQLGHNFGVFEKIQETRQQFSNSVFWVKGAHAMTFGTDVNFLQDSVLRPPFTPMRIVLPGVNCLVQFANFVNPDANVQENASDPPCPLPPFLEGTPIIFWGNAVGAGAVTPGMLAPALPTDWKYPYLPSQAGDYTVPIDHSYYGLFWQDQWKISPKLTFNYGLRWDYEHGLGESINPDYRGFQPRIGVAYAPDKKTVVRAGFGIFDDRYSLPFLFNTQKDRPVQIPGVQLPGIAKGADRGTGILSQMSAGPGGLPADTAKTLILTGQTPPIYITGPCPPSCVVGAGMVDHNSRIPYSEQASFSMDREIANGLTVSMGYLFTGAHKLVRALDLNISAPAGRLPDGKLQYDGAAYNNAGLLYYTDNSGNAVYHGATFQVNERWGGHLTFNANYTFSKTLDDGTFTTFVSTPQSLYQRNLERANSNQDVRHRFVGNFVAVGPEHGRLRNLQLSGIVTMQSPRPFTIFAGFDVNGDTNPVTDRVGLSARNTYWGDRLYAVDLRLSRSFRINEKANLLVAMDAFNLLNRANVDEVTTVYGAADFIGGIPNSYKDGVGSPVNPLFGSPRSVLNPRQLQFSLKLAF